MNLFHPNRFQKLTPIALTLLAAFGLSVTRSGAQSLNSSATAQASGVYYLDPQFGNDNNPGTQNQPWKTLPKAIASLPAGSTVILDSGIYSLDSTQTYMLGPSGTDVSHKTTYKAASGARPIVTGFDQKPVNIHLMAYMHVEGIWFGGSWDTVDGIDAFGHGASNNPLFVLGGPLNDVINCTFFGYAQTSNGADYLFFQGNRSVRTGGGDLSHGIYLSGHDGTTNQEDNHAIVDNNLFIGQEVQNPHYGYVSGAPPTYLMGLGIQSWHIHNNDIITRNFVTHHIANAIEANTDDNSVRSELVANNFWWKMGLAANNSYPDGFWSSKHLNYFNNLGGPGGGVASSDIQATTIGNTFATNAFMLGISNHLLPNAPTVSAPGPLALSEANTAAAVGTTPSAIDQAIAALQYSFSIGVNGKTVHDLLIDQTVEPNFAKLNFSTVSSSTLYHTGTPWFNPANPALPPDSNSITNVGPGIQVPATPGDFWAAFRALGMQDYDDSGHRMTAPYPTYPYPSAANTKNTIGVFAPATGTFYLRNTNTSGFANETINFNPPGKNYPIIGDWLGIGVDTIGVFNQNNGIFTLCTLNGTASCAVTSNHITFALGTANDTPLAGRWSFSASHDGAGVYRPSNGILYLKNTLNTGYADFAMIMGLPGDQGVAGDWTGKGFDSPGIYRPASFAFFLSNVVTSGVIYANIAMAFGSGNSLPVIGDWTGQANDGVGLFNTSQKMMYLKNTVGSGFADASFSYGATGEIPIAGYWGTGAPAPNPGKQPPPLITQAINPTSVPGGSSASVPSSGQIGN